MKANPINENKGRSVLELSYDEARAFFLKAESYCSFDLPPYIKFGPLLSEISAFLEKSKLSSLHSSKHKPRDCEHLNHIIFSNKDGKYAWRPMQLIHPALYVSLAHTITEETHWQVICSRFSQFSANPKIECLSLPVESLSEEKDKAEQITTWWLEVEQSAIELALDYEYVAHSDITDCYGAIYTHSIAWSLHTKEKAKKNKRNKQWIGNLIDTYLQDMSRGQTNGIPQGTVLMDFVAEMVLGYADQELTEKLDNLNPPIGKYKILRYRDDYRIFSNSPQECEVILKALTETLIELGLKLSPSKTFLSSRVIQASIKSDKLGWMTKIQWAKDLQKHLLLIHDHSLQFPNSGSLETALDKFYRRIINKKVIRAPMPLISIAVDIAYHNPRTYRYVAAILSKLITMIDDQDEKRRVIQRIKRRFERLANTGHMQIWLQRISLPIEKSIFYSEPMCQLVTGDSKIIWNMDWIASKEFKKLLDATKIIEQTEIENLKAVVPLEEIELYKGYR